MWFANSINFISMLFVTQYVWLSQHMEIGDRISEIESIIAKTVENLI